MLSIFKAVRDNNVDTVRDFIQLASAGNNTIVVNTASISSNNKNNDNNKNDNKYDPQQRQQHYRQFFQRYSKTTGQKQFNINKRSIRGRTALHCAATWNRKHIAKILIDCPLVNINIQDRENGWTALHRALYMGNLEIALLLLQRGDADISIKDWEGLRPLELLSITLDNFPVQASVDPQDYNNGSGRGDDVEDKEFDVEVNIIGKEKPLRSGGTDLYSWGSNTNYLLGHRDSENRTNPEHIHLDHLESQQQTNSIMQRPIVLIQSVKMSKNHMAILTSESRHNLLLCGFGRGGRLGSGSEIDAQLIPTPVQWPERIIVVALGRDHTVGVSERGNVITFGSNEYGQLGHETEDMQQLVPHKIQAPSLKKQKIVGAAASTIHSVVYTQTDLFTFGYNKGQLGYHAVGDDVRQVNPRKVALNNKIKQVVAIEYATAVLLESNEVILLCNYTQQKIIFSTNRFPANMQVYTSASTHMVKLIQSGDEYLGAISNMGEVYLWTCRPTSTKQQNDGNKSKLKQSLSSFSYSSSSTIVSNPKRIWDLKKPHLAAIDASLGHRGELIVSTISGQVFVGNPTKDHVYKFRMIPKLQRCIQVCASPSGAFAAIRSEVKPVRILAKRSTFEDDLSSSLPHVLGSRQLVHNMHQLDKEKYRDIIRLSQRIDELICEDPPITTSTDIDDGLEEKKKGIEANYKERLKDTVIKAWDQAISIASQDRTANVMFNCESLPKPIYCHGCILSCRSPFFKQLFNKSKEPQHYPDLDIIWRDAKTTKTTTTTNKNNNRVEIHIRKPISVAAMLLFCDYVYSDVYNPPIGFSYHSPYLSRFNNDDSFDKAAATMVQKDLAMLASIFDMDLLHDSSLLSYANIPRPSLKTDMLQLLDDQNSCDVILDLEGGEHVYCHEVILRQRCPFFESLFEPGSVWMEARREQVTSNDPLVHVQMTHISQDLMLPLLRYLYADMDEEELFGEMVTETPDEMMRYLIDFLRISDELLLTRLKCSCERALVKFLNLRTVIHLVESSDLYLATNLKHSCLDFIVANLDIFLTSGMLEGVDSQIIQDLERYVRYCHAYQLPTVREIMLPSPAPITREDDVDEEFESSLYILSREETPIVSNYCETLITVLPETPASPLTPKSEENNEVFAMDEDHQLKSTSASIRNKKNRKQQRLIFDSAGDNSSPTSNTNNGSAKLWQGWGPTPDLSLESVEAKVSLREVLEQHPKSSILISSTPPSSFGKSPPHIPKKLSQKERRKLQQQEIAAAAAVAAAPKTVWGKVETESTPSATSKTIASSPVDFGYPSLGASTVVKDNNNTGPSNGNTSASSSSNKETEIMTTKNSTQGLIVNDDGVEDDGSKGKKIYISKEELDDTLNQNNNRRFSKDDDDDDDGLFKPELSLGPGFSFTPIRRRHGPMTTRKNSQEQCGQHSFQAIQKQQEQEDLWIKGKQARKNLIQIQAEQKAMDGLQQFYIQTLDAKSGDWFEVNRLET